MGNEFKYIVPQRSKRPVDLKNANPQKLQAYINAPASVKGIQGGIGGNRSIEPVPVFKKSNSEKVYSNSRNAWLVLGVDRNSTLTTGYGGKGHTQCAAIDLVVELCI